jgi:hypothetical protein
MQTPRLSKERQQRFLAALVEGGDVTAAAVAAGTYKMRVQEVREVDSEFAAEWDRALELSADRLEQEARRRAVEGIREPLVSEGKVVRDDDGQPIVIRRYSDSLLLALLKTQRPEKFNEYRISEAEIYPRWLRYLVIAFVFAFSVWAIGSLAIGLIRLHTIVAVAPR